jgi:polynucleotide 5'-hydroxyl-kinase GRC3/NOL9
MGDELADGSRNRRVPHSLMLSAIAARKARLQLTPQVSSKKRKSSPKTPQIPEKRPRSHPSFNSSAKGTRKNTPKHDVTTSVTTSPDALTGEEDAIPPNSSDDDDSDMSITLDDKDTTLVPQGHPTEPTRRERTKAWSPSRPVVDSSDEASDVSVQPLSDPSHFFHHIRPLPNEELEILSTYQPVHGQNMFRLLMEEGSALGLSGPAVILVLSPSATVSFVGTYRLRVLRGSISLLGTIIQSSHVLHHVFAPRSSPIPVIRAHMAHEESSKSLSDIPAQIINTIAEDDVLIVLQELRTGIEGLGRVVRTFEGVFDQVNPEGAPDLPLKGVHLVGHSLSEDVCLTHEIAGNSYRPRYAYLSGTAILGGCIFCIIVVLRA